LSACSRFPADLPAAEVLGKAIAFPHSRVPTWRWRFAELTGQGASVS
jgi:hypothetical protein